MQTKTIFLLILSVFMPNFIECMTVTKNAENEKASLEKKLVETMNETEGIKDSNLRFELKDAASIKMAIRTLDADLGSICSELVDKREQLLSILSQKKGGLGLHGEVYGFGYIKVLPRYSPEIKSLEALLKALDRKRRALVELIGDLEILLQLAEADL